MLYLNKMSVSYINYHRQPRVEFTSIQEYNKKFNTDVPQNKTFELKFEQAWKRARKETDPNEFIQHQFDVEDMGWFSDKLKSAKKNYTKLKRKARDKFLTKDQKESAHQDDLIKDAEDAKRQKDKALRAKMKKDKKEKEKAAAKEAEEKEFQEYKREEEEKPKPPEDKPDKKPIDRKDAVSEDVEEKDEKADAAVPNISDFLDDYDEEDDEEEMVNVPTLHEQIDSFIAEQAKDSESFKRDRAHVVHFNTGSDNIAERLMKGRERYMKRLKAYANGDDTVKIRMMSNKEVLVSKLNPCKDSITELLNTKHGNPRFVRVACDCH